ncbi:hypothetical protein G1H11_07120 [Phytoactinopolyspora alkaliphila]|uniref:DUF4258 domain-containing protein n=1 Tax=Phytoactinopolyspora alkaliphila TaxID=1783498 RepID=A0A6N9YJE8_9ACTN|nr:hypothetical protein [Phytoactinopolyspora alkaliphila]NED95082.1 hypothetical protein [Phytoactinopolyspora alkaliphila]
MTRSIFVAHNRKKPVKFSRSARRHKIGKAHALAAMNHAGDPTLVPATEKYDEQWVWIGRDDRNIELRIIGLDRSDCILVIHVQPTTYVHQESNDD